MIKFSVPSLTKGPVTLRGSEPADFLELAPDDPIQPVSPMKFELTARLADSGILLTGNCQAEISATCGRCLEPVRQLLSVDNLQLFFELESGQEELDVSEDVRCELLLEVPMNPVCADDCLGLCPVCGGNRNLKECTCGNQPHGDLCWGALDGLKL